MHNIINLELPPGSAVSENELSATLDVSRTPVRESLKEMSYLGLVDIIPQKGSFVTKIDYELIEDVQFMRVALESSVVRVICQKGISDEYAIRLKENLERQKKLSDLSQGTKEIFELDNQFHKLLYEAVGKIRPYEILTRPMVHFDRLRVLAFIKS